MGDIWIRYNRFSRLANSASKQILYSGPEIGSWRLKG